MKTIAIATQKGGVGKTTSALELAAAFAQEDKKVLLVDFDQQGNLTDYVGADGIESQYTVYDVLHDADLMKKAIIGMNLFDFVKSSPELSKADVEFNNSEDVFLLDDALDKVRKKYDYIIIDNGPQRNKLLQMTYVTADYIISPCDDTEGGSKGLINVYNDVEKMKKTKVPLSSADIIGAIVTRYKGQTTINKVAISILEDAMKKINKRGFVMYVRDSVKASEAKYAKISVQEYSPYNNVAMDYRDIAEAIVKYEKGDKKK